MAANTSPIYTLSPDVSTDGSTGMGTTLTTAANDYTGISVNNVLEFTAGADGSYIRKIRFKAVGTNVATVARIYINNGSTNTSANNNSFYEEVSLPATTTTATSPTATIDVPMEIGINAGFKIYIGLGTTVVGGWIATVVGGKY